MPVLVCSLYIHSIKNYKTLNTHTAFEQNVLAEYFIDLLPLSLLMIARIIRASNAVWQGQHLFTVFNIADLTLCLT